MEVPKARGAGRSGPRRRTGCLTCRARKVRCDEGKPSCSNCDRLRLQCLYKPPVAPGVGWGSSPTRPSNNITASPNNTADIGSSGSPAAAATASRSPDMNFFSTVLRADGHTISTPTTTLGQLPTDQESYLSEFDMLGFMGGVTSDLEQKHLDLTTGLSMAFTASPALQSLPATLIPGMDEGYFSADRRVPFTPDTSPSLVDRTSIDSAAEVPTTRGSLSDAGGTSYEDQLLQHFLTIDPPAALFAPVNIEWKLSSSEIQACIHGEVTESTLIKVFGAVFLLMISEILSSPEICTGTSYIHSGYLILQRFHNRTRHWTGLGHLLVSWVSLLDVKSLIAGRDGDPLTELGNIPEHRLDTQNSQTPHTKAPTDSIEDPFLSPNYLIYESIVGPAFRFFVQAQQVVRRIVCIDLHHRSRGTLTDEFEVLQLAHKVGADLETLWHRRPSVIDVYGRPEALTDILCVPVASEICRTFRQYVANFLANFIYLHRVAFAIYPRTDRVNGAIDQIIQLATVDSTGRDHLPVSFLWPLFVAGLEGTDDQRKWIVHEIQRMAAAHEANSAPSVTRHPAVDRVLVLVEEMTRRQDVSSTWADSKCVRRELFSDFFVMI
ncbi:hypothetical protein N7519_006013 [Penicillium mononematosum]|uniref:uncharacterized protein n=1 Tax=Penicillium mononematosum TaxID=268346 RepID=UPI002546D296|nr:uncharacterized protein N7519_006013 [Penicillium mononematosum]KAJ6184712.1 hypothetical protein N7519_006013 [Penicillium mononematosum]